MNDADGFALMFWVTVGGLLVALAAGGIERLLRRPNRDWVRELRNRERARRIVAGCWRPGKTTRQDFQPSGGWLKDETK